MTIASSQRSPNGAPPGWYHPTTKKPPASAYRVSLTGVPPSSEGDSPWGKSSLRTSQKSSLGKPPSPKELSSLTPKNNFLGDTQQNKAPGNKVVVVISFEEENLLGACTVFVLVAFLAKKLLRSWDRCVERGGAHGD